MEDIRYLLCIKELWNSQSAELLREQAYAKVDEERKRKLARIKHERKYAESLGAGLLLQLGAQRFDGFCKGCGSAIERDGLVYILTLSEVIAQLGEPIEIEYSYGEKGKPYFQNFPIYFNLSHSEDYVCCVFSKQEIGVDIQYKKSLANDCVVKHFFTEAEQRVWDRCSTREEREQCFYRLWTRKEAYGKLTGEGIAMAASANVLENETLGVFWEEYEKLEGYQISICKWRGEKE